MQKSFLSLNLTKGFESPTKARSHEQQQLARERDKLRSMLLHSFPPSSRETSSPSTASPSPSVERPEETTSLAASSPPRMFRRPGPPPGDVPLLHTSVHENEGNLEETGPLTSKGSIPMPARPIGGVWGSVLRPSASRSRSGSVTSSYVSAHNTTHPQRPPSTMSSSRSPPSPPKARAATGSPVSDEDMLHHEAAREIGASVKSKTETGVPLSRTSGRVTATEKKDASHPPAAPKRIPLIPSFLRPTTASLTRSILVEEEQAKRQERRARRQQQQAQQRREAEEARQRRSQSKHHVIRSATPSTSSHFSPSWTWADKQRGSTSGGPEASSMPPRTPSPAKRSVRSDPSTLVNYAHERERPSHSRVDRLWEELQRVEDALEWIAQQHPATDPEASQAAALLELTRLREDLLAALDVVLEEEETDANRIAASVATRQIPATPLRTARGSMSSSVPSASYHHEGYEDHEAERALPRPAVRITSSLSAFQRNPVPSSLSHRASPQQRQSRSVSRIGETRGPWSAYTPPKPQREDEMPPKGRHPSRPTPLPSGKERLSACFRPASRPARPSPPSSKAVEASTAASERSSPTRGAVVRLNRAQIKRQEAIQRALEERERNKHRLWASEDLDAERLAAMYRAQHMTRSPARHRHEEEDASSEESDGGVWPRHPAPLSRRHASREALGMTANVRSRSAAQHRLQARATSSAATAPTANTTLQAPNTGGRYQGWLPPGDDSTSNQMNGGNRGRTTHVSPSSSPSPSRRVKWAETESLYGEASDLRGTLQRHEPPTSPSPSRRRRQHPWPMDRSSPRRTRLQSVRHWESPSPSPMLPERRSFLADDDDEGTESPDGIDDRLRWQQTDCDVAVDTESDEIARNPFSLEPNVGGSPERPRAVRKERLLEVSKLSPPRQALRRPHGTATTDVEANEVSGEQLAAPRGYFSMNSMRRGSGYDPGHEPKKGLMAKSLSGARQRVPQDSHKAPSPPSQAAASPPQRRTIVVRPRRALSEESRVAEGQLTLRDLARGIDTGSTNRDALRPTNPPTSSSRPEASTRIPSQPSAKVSSLHAPSGSYVLDSRLQSISPSGVSITSQETSRLGREPLSGDDSGILSLRQIAAELSAVTGRKMR